MNTSKLALFLLTLPVLILPELCYGQKTTSPDSNKLLRVIQQVEKRVYKKVRRKAVRRFKKQARRGRLEGKAFDGPAVVTLDKLKVQCSKSGKAIVTGTVLGSYDRPLFTIQTDVAIDFQNCNGITGEGGISGETTRQPGVYDAENMIQYQQEIKCTRLSGEKVPGEITADILFVTEIELESSKAITRGTGDLDVTCEFQEGSTLTVLACEWQDLDVKDKQGISDGCTLFPFS